MKDSYAGAAEAEEPSKCDLSISHRTKRTYARCVAVMRTNTAKGIKLWPYLSYTKAAVQEAPKSTGKTSRSTEISRKHEYTLGVAIATA